MKGIYAILLFPVLSFCFAQSSEIKLNADDNGCQIEMKKGQILEITLEGNPTTGYTWEATDLEEDILQLEGEPEFKPETKAIGAPGVQILRFKAVDVGEIDLDLVYHRPWEEDKKPLETFSVKIIIC